MAHVEIGPVIFQFIEEWSQFFQPCNWRTFHPVMFEAEDDGLLGGFEVTAILMGLGLRVRWDHSKTEFKDEILKRAEDIRKDGRGDAS